jgi:histidinol phosphatase-like PHP family hydrolase
LHLHTYFFTGEDMTNDEIINLAIENTIHGLKFDEEGLLRFAKLVAQHEREACAKECDACICTAQASEAIRARDKHDAD